MVVVVFRYWIFEEKIMVGLNVAKTAGLNVGLYRLGVVEYVGTGCVEYIGFVGVR